MGSDSEFNIKAPKQIISNLTQLMKQNCLISCHYGENNESFITTLLAIDNKKKTLFLDFGPKDYLNKQLLQSPQVEFRTELAGIKVAFDGKKITKTSLKGQQAFAMAIPEELFWMQRREYYRVRVPLSHDSYCRITLPVTDKDSEENTEEKTLQCRLIDISICGIALTLMDIEHANQFIPTTEFKDCLLVLAGNEFGPVNLTVKNRQKINPEKADKGYRIGCSLDNLTSGQESCIQRYMQEIERELSNIK